MAKRKARRVSSRPSRTKMVKRRAGAHRTFPTREPQDTRLFLEMATKPPPEQLGVVLRFLQEDVEALDGQERVAWSSRLKALALRPLVSPSGRLTLQFQAASSYQALPARSLKAIQANIDRGIRATIAPRKGNVMADAWPLPDLLGGSMFRDTRGAGQPSLPPPRARHTWQWNIQGEDWPIILGAAQLVAEHAKRVRACKVCDALFVAVKRQEYCTPEHGQQARDERKTGRKTGGSR